MRSVKLVSGNVFISAAEHHWLKNDPVDLLDVICNESNDVANPIIIQSVDHSYLKGGFHAGGRDVVQSAAFGFNIVANSAVTILFFGDPVELQINAVKPGGPRPNGKLFLLRKANSIGRDMKPMEAHALSVLDCV
jgi:hypothetical protein